MREAWKTNGVMLNAKDFIINPTFPIPQGSPDGQVSGVFIYLVNMLVKLGLKLSTTAATNMTYNAVDPIGVILAFVISLGEFRIAGNAFQDIYIAKYHQACPPLFGIHGLESTVGGRTRLGWQKDGDGAFVDANTHYDRLNGVASGYAALTLRDFSRTTEKNALPAWHYWRTLAGILNLDAAQLTKSHAVILKGLINQYAQHFVKFYGAAAIGVLRIALIQKPQQAPQDTGFDTLTVVRDNLKAQFALEI
jgi:nucleoporin GLE1